MIAQRFIAAACAAAALALQAAPLVKTEHVEADLVAERTGAVAGQPATLGLRLRMAPQWHTYWKNPGDSGLPTRIKWTLPEGWKAGEIQWPYPHRLPIGPLMNYGYEDEVVLLVDVTPAADAKPGTYPIHAHADWLVCKDICIPEKGDLELPVTVGGAAPQVNGRVEASIERARNGLPVTAEGWTYDASIDGKALVVRLMPPPGAAAPTQVVFYPEREQLVEPAAPQKISRDGNGVRIEMKLAEPPLKGVTKVAGVAVSDNGWPGIARKAISVEAPVGGKLAAAAGVTGGAARDALGGSMLAAIGFALLGGVLLNLMPCVFPVLGIKVMGFVQHAHGEARAMRLQGVAFFAGAVLSFLALSGLMLALRAGGTQLGWGFQLQSPVVVTLLAALFFVLALNLSGVFEWGAFAQSVTANLTAKGRYADACLSGVLAAVVATPCTAPFMGAAVGFTLTQSSVQALAIFAALGIGMALPVLALSFFPSLLRRLPRPGAWMETFKQVLAFPLYATVAWLAWVLGAQSGNDAVFALLGGLVLVAIGAWMYGRSEHAPGLWRTVLAVLFAGAGLVVAWPGHGVGDAGLSPVAQAGELAWEPWSPERVRELTAQGQPVFVDFTAAWCVTCQVNKRVSLHDAAVVKAFGDRGVVALRADWTRQDPRITEALAALGRNAVPVYALYVPGSAEPHLLPELLTPALVLAEIEPLPAHKSALAASETPRKLP